MTRPTTRFVAVLTVAGLAGVVLAQTPQPPTPTKQTPPAPTPKPAPKPVLPPNVLARVGNQDITRDQVLGMVDLFNGRPFVDQLVEITLVEQEAKRLGVTTTEAEVAQGIKEMKEQIVQQQMMRGKPMTFEEIAAEQGFSDRLLRWNVRYTLLRRKTFVKANESQFPSRDNQVKLAHILIATVPLPTNPNEQPKPLTPDEQKKKEEQAKMRIDTLYAGLKDKKITWEDAVRQSEDPVSATHNGELDFYGPGVLDPAFEKAGFALEKPGDIVGPVKSQFGWHIIKLVAKGKDLPATEKDAYRKQQEAMILNDPRVIQAWVQQLREKTPVVMNSAGRVYPNGTPPNGAVAPKATGAAPAPAIKPNAKKGAGKG